MQQSKTLEVFYHGESIGTLAETPDKRIAFQYTNNWQKNGFSINPHSLPLDNTVFVPNSRSLDRFGGLFGIFADSLPDTWGELLLDRHLEEIGIPRSSISTLDRLAFIGTNGMGALEYHPSRNSDYDMKHFGMDYDTIAKECEKVLSSKRTDQLDILYQMGGSSGGTRPKIFLSENDREWIIKFPSKTDPEYCGKREYDYSLCAKDCGIHMTDTALIPSNSCEGYFKTERYDRQNGEKVFCATFAGLLEADYRAPACDYEILFKLVRALTKDYKPDVEQLYRVMCFNVATHNLDDHMKNFSMVYTSDHSWRFAPAYDLTYSDTYWGEHMTSVKQKGKNIQRDHLLSLGRGAGLSDRFCRQTLDEILEKTAPLKKYMGKYTGKESEIHLPFRERLAEFHADVN